MTNDQLAFIVPASVTIVLFLSFFGMLAWVRWLRYLEVVALAERGFAPREDLPGAATHRWGMVFLAIGVAITVAMYPLSAAEFPAYPLGISPILLGGLLPLAVGVALLWHHRKFGARARRAAPEQPLDAIGTEADA